MDSTTTDICEWCRKPMLVNVVQEAMSNGQTDVVEASGTEGEEGHLAQIEAINTGSELAHPLDVARDKPITRPSDSDDIVLQPLGGGSLPKPPAAAPRSGGPSHGLSQESLKTTIDVANYMGADGIFKPIPRHTQGASMPGGDPLAQMKHAKEMKVVSDIPENRRLLQSLVAGLVICIPLAIIQSLITHSVPDKFYFYRLGDTSSIVTAIKFGLFSGFLLGLMLGALLVKWKKGPVLGMLFGIAIGYFGLQNGYFGLVSGGLSGLFVGRFATTGLRKTVNV